MSTSILKNAFTVSFALIFLACSVFTPGPASRPSAEEVEKEEQAVYSFFVSKSGTVLILQDTSTNISEEDPEQTMDHLKSGLKGVSSETLKSYLERNKQPSQLSDDMQLGVDYVLLNTVDLAKITRQPNWHEILREKYPGSSGYLIFSRVGFNSVLDQAVIYVGNVAGPLMGSGSYYLMEKEAGQWIVKEQLMAWIS